MSDDLSPFALRRRRLLSAHPETAFLLPGAPRARRAHDVEYRYRADSDLFYLTGWTGPEAVALLRLLDGAPHLVLFVAPRDPDAERWSGPRPGPEGAVLELGADQAYPTGDLSSRLPTLLVGARELCYPLGRDRTLDDLVLGALGAAKILARRRQLAWPERLRFPEPLLGALRAGKDDGEVAALRRACASSAAGHLAALRVTRPGLWERDLEAILELTFRQHGAEGPANPCIVGGGVNATVLHYDANRDPLRPGDLVLVDAGAEQDHYVGDITRTYPVDGRFSPVQRQVYQIVLDAQRAAIATVRPGVTLGQVHEAAALGLLEGLCALGILSGAPWALFEQGAHLPYYPHRTSHWLGLDVHDPSPAGAGDPEPPLVPGMVLTVEPGLYFGAEPRDLPPGLAGLGVRIEDDLLVTPSGCEVLTAEVPVEPEELEALVGSAPLPRP